MAGKIKINTERCKGCGLCVAVCPKGNVVISATSNKNGYFPAISTNSDCAGCAVCAIICPDAVIEVYRDTKIVAIESGKKGRVSLAREKR